MLASVLQRRGVSAAVCASPAAFTMLYLGLSCLLLRVFVVFGTELTFELPDNDKQCFYEQLEKDVRLDVDFQVSYSESSATSLYLSPGLSSTVNLLFEWFVFLGLGKEEHA